MAIIWCMVPQIWSTTDRIFFHSGPFFALLHKCTKVMIICYTVPEIWHVMDVIVIFILGYFLPFLLAPKMKISKKWKQETLHIVTIVMICCSLASPWKFQYFQRHICNSVKHPWWSFYCKNSKPLIVFTKKLHHRCSLGF